MRIAYSLKASDARTRLGAIILAALAVTILASLRFLYILPFSGNTRGFNYETITTMASVFIYNEEPFGFPIGAIKGLTFPFQAANVGNVGGIPLFAIPFKLLGRMIPYFRTFDYFIFLELVSCFFTAFFAQCILSKLGVRHWCFRALGALLTGVSFLFFYRSEGLQPFCTVSFPLFAAWIYAALITLERGHWKPLQDTLILLLFPITSLADNYTLVGIFLGTGALALREYFEAFFGGAVSSRNRAARLTFFCAGGVALSYLALYTIGMIPTPPLNDVFTSYDHGMGGRIHVADLLSPLLPVISGENPYIFATLPFKLGIPLHIGPLGSGASGEMAFIGTAALLLWIALIFMRLLFPSLEQKIKARNPGRLTLFSPWKKIVVASFFVFFFSMGYRLYIYGTPFPLFAGMPGAWISDRIPALYTFRAPGRLATLLSLVLILEAVRRLAHFFEGENRFHIRFAIPAAAFLAAVHLVEIVPFLKPLAPRPVMPLGQIFTEAEAAALRGLAKNHTAVLIAPSPMISKVSWTPVAFAAGYHFGIPSNLFFIARYEASHFYAIFRDLDLVEGGNWDALRDKYGDVLFALPTAKADALRAKVQKNYLETKVGPLSVWTHRSKSI